MNQDELRSKLKSHHKKVLLALVRGYDEVDGGHLMYLLDIYFETKKTPTPKL